ncbi:methyltransferase [Aidingimonas halophila]|uniref:Ribosomal RNA small subunit methyltransferase C n=1 Tax=Aidingimonas halophila TaxID=574349 RepID=A0A1H2RKV1_9GAMM|nr:methyltransferase [Aidingimonas halophila]GHC19050.1 ribosomal RNA small subunit methyltransferase C [Aidingimonas halophila]SDW20041.1 16S rRNA m(2)G 1207 methyltransferase [Aidingimonas halophila]
MKAQTSVCQLLDRQSMDYRGWWWVAPPQDEWLLATGGGVLTGDQGVLDTWRASGGSASSALSTEPLGEIPGVVLFWPKSHALGEWWLLALCERLPVGTPLQVVGENQGGVKRVLKVLAALGLGCRKRDSARRCSLFETRLDRVSVAADAAWQTFEAEHLTLASHPGVFGHGKLDDGTRLLLSTLDAYLPDATRSVLDLGCGDGVIGAWLASRGADVTLVDINLFAVEAARRTLAINDLQGEALPSDVYSALEDRRFDMIVTNPPFHQERRIDYGHTARLIQEAPSHLASGGQLLMVANAFLPYPDLLESTFGKFEIVADDRRYRVYRVVLSERDAM